MKYRIPALVLCVLVLNACVSLFEDTGSIELTAGDLLINMGDDARITRLMNSEHGDDHQHPDSVSCLIRMRFGKQILKPQSVTYSKAENMLYFYFPGNREVKVGVGQYDEYIAFELINIRSMDQPDLLIWGPLYTNISETIGETIGVVRNAGFAIGIQALNPKTLGGYPWLENDVMPEMDYFDQNNYSDLKKGGVAHTLYRIEAARPVEMGSTLHAYCRSRNEDRSISNWGYDNYLVRRFDDGGLIGSSVAFFGCPPEKVLQTISKIETGEGLPHPMINGQWSKLAPEASSAYLIIDFGEEDFERALEYTQRAGLKYLYHSSPFESWGHFKLKESYFPEGRLSLKHCVEKAEAKGISIGLHTLSNFITTNDPYVTPVPDQRLAETGYSQIISDIGLAEKEIVVKDPASFNQFRNNYLKSCRIGNEIIRYEAVSNTEPWTLIDCQRGAFETGASSHSKDDTIFKLADHAYKVFLSNPALTYEIAENIAGLYNETEVRQISFDGLEGCRSTGLGNYGEILFTDTWYDNLNDDIRSHFIADASRSSHYFWHIFTRMNWGEPWYAGFRESQTEYRLKNQKYFDRNYIPNMLGWFLMKPETSLEDIEWLLARSAAFDAGYAFVTSYDALEKNGLTDDILAAVSLWERLRMKGIFSAGQKSLMEDVNNEFHLEKTGSNEYVLSRIYSYRMAFKFKESQPGEPQFSSAAFENPGEKQLLQFIITAKSGSVINPQMEIGVNNIITIPVKLNEGEHLKFNGEFAGVYDSRWHLLKSISLDKNILTLAPGSHHIEFSCSFLGNEGEMQLELRLMGEIYNITDTK